MIELDTIYNMDCLQGLKHLPDCSVDCCVTSPPYYALRDYGCEGQIGLEETPEEYIRKLTEVFMEVYRVLKPEGTLWLNIGDSYNGSGGNHKDTHKNDTGFQGNIGVKYGGKGAKVDGLKPKDLIGIPWKIAEALRGPFYYGKIKNEKDRIWLAAMIDAEGSICGTFHERSDGYGNRTSVFICVTNANADILSKCFDIYGYGTTTLHQKNGSGHLGNRDIYRWNVNGIDEKTNIICEIYPYLIAKKKQALLAYNFFLMQKDAKKTGHSEKKDEVNEKRRLIVKLLSLLNKGNDVDIPSWCVEPPSLYRNGFYLRQGIIWHKPNPMPESVTDRCTKAHEYIFLLSKSQKYYFDYETISEPCADQNRTNYQSGSRSNGENKDRNDNDLGERSKTWKPRTKNCQYDGQRPNTMHLRREQGLPDREYLVRNKRDVWSVNVRADSVAHFATYPEQLIVPCILAGCPKGGIVLDPFMGSGTTARVARHWGRHYLGFELNNEYMKIINEKTKVETDLFAR